MAESGIGDGGNGIRLDRWLLPSIKTAQFNFVEQNPFLTKIPTDGSALSTNQGINW